MNCQGFQLCEAYALPKLNQVWKQESTENEADTINAFKGHCCIYPTAEIQTVKRGV